jgi:hypothetical protein
MLPEIRIASPCTASWESMTGDDRSRHCSECNRNVYNFAAMTSTEIEQLIAASNGDRLCGRLYRRDDGTILTSDCPVGLRVRIRRVSRRLSAALVAAISFACTAKAVPQQDTSMLGDVAVAQSGFNLFAVHNESPVGEAQITVIDPKSHKIVATGKTDDAGKFGLAIAPGEYTILVQRIGLVSQSVPVSIKQYEMQQVTAKLQNRNFTMGIVAIPTLRNLQKK